ncbi:glycosyltransferase [Vibrio metschnikovii]|nr:glycosyltransferase [Vibrio metschnikovii]
MSIVVDSLVSTMDRDNVEVVVQDNSEIADKEVVSRITSYDMVKYFHDPTHVPIAVNTDRAIDNSSGDYILFIGDDDFVHPDVLKYVKILNSSNYECLSYNPAYYWWGSVIFHKKDYYHRPRNLWLPKRQNDTTTVKSTSESLNHYEQKGGVSIVGLPRAYHGIVSRQVLKRIKDKHGTYVIGSSPDISLAISICHEVEDFMFIDKPISVYGACKNSGGGWTASRTHHSKIEEVNFLRKDILANWSHKIPRIWSERTIYPQTYVEVVRAYNGEDNINYLKLYSALIAYEPFLIDIFLPTIRKQLSSHRFSYIGLSYYTAKKFFGLIYKKLNGKLRGMPFRVIKLVDEKDVVKKL